MPIGPITEIAFQNPEFSNILWKMTPASFARRLSDGRFQAWNYVQLLSRKLVDVATGRCKRLIVVCPPRHGKSELVSKWFPSWYFETYPANRIILASYEADFASKWGGRVRDILMSNQDLLSVRFKNKVPAAHYWETSEEGAMMCAGVGGPITGKGGNVIIIDDYVKNAEEANSLTMRNKTWDWYTSTLHSRIEPRASIIVMATRWHSDDLIGRILQNEADNIRKREEGDKRVEIEGWEVFCFPAEAEPEAERHYIQYGVKVNDLRVSAITQRQSIRDVLVKEGGEEWRDLLGRKRGEPLCPDRYTEKDLAQFKSLNSRDWFALYQQRPGDDADDGNVYHRFDEQVHCRPLLRDPHLQLFVSMDFNVNPMCTVIGQYDKNANVRSLGRQEILEELILPNSNTPEMMMRLLKELNKYKMGYTLDIEIYGDSAGTQRSPNSVKTNWQIVAEYMQLDTTITYRFVRKKNNPMIGDRVNAVNTMFRAADGVVRMYVDDTKCPELVKDFKKVRWALDSGGNSTGQLDKSDPKRTHISDALGYEVEYNFGLRGKAGAKKGIMQ